MRKSNFELLRIISMFLILMSHCDDIFGLANLYSAGLGTNKLITDWLHAGGQIGVGCFLLISGYFMVEKTVTIKKMLRLAGEVWFYSIGIWVVWAAYKFCNSGFDKTVITEAIYAFFPITFSHYWFVTAYVILMVLSPYFNKLIWVMSKEEYKKFLTCLLVIFVVIQGGIPYALTGMSEGRILPVFLFYFIAGYLKRFRTEKTTEVKKHMTNAIMLYIFLIASFYVITLIGIKLDSTTIVGLRYFYRVLNSPIVVIICIELFLAMSEMNIDSSVIVNEIAGCTFGVYLLHQNRLLGTYLYKIFPIYKETRSLYIFVYSIISVVSIYLVCTVIDFIRKKTVERWWFIYLDKHVGDK